MDIKNSLIVNSTDDGLSNDSDPEVDPEVDPEADDLLNNPEMVYEA
jgi:hypothetical protein